LIADARVDLSCVRALFICRGLIYQAHIFDSKHKTVGLMNQTPTILLNKMIAIYKVGLMNQTPTILLNRTIAIY